VLQEPSASAEIPEATGVSPRETAMAVSLAAKPEPETVSNVPGFPRVPLRETAGVTVKGVSRSEPEPETLIEYAPFGDGGMVKVVVQEP
jgi:hypothetical protein